jgi:hypothetical protein
MATPHGVLARYQQLRQEVARRNSYKFAAYFLDDGPFRRELYPKHIQFFDAGVLFKERLLMAANRVGKSGQAHTN